MNFWGSSLISVAIITSYFASVTLAGNNACLFSKVMASKTKVTYKDARYRKSEMISSLGIRETFTSPCASQCCGLSWCRLWCIDTSSDGCIFSNIIITPGYQERNMTDALSCFTTPVRDLIVGANITVSKTSVENQERIPDNISDGIYEFFNLRHCFLSQPSKNPWIVADLGNEEWFMNIRLVAQYNNNSRNFSNIEVRVGTSQVSYPEGLNLYKLFGYYSGPAEEDEEVILTSPTPVLARYVSVQRMERGYIQVCHLQVY